MIDKQISFVDLNGDLALFLALKLVEIPWDSEERVLDFLNRRSGTEKAHRKSIRKVGPLK